VARPRHDIPPNIARRSSSEIIIACLEWAGQIQLSTHTKSPFPSSYRSYWPEFPHNPRESFGYESSRLSAPRSTAPQIELSDEVFAWLGKIPEILPRRIVGFRALRLPLIGRHLYPWPRIAILLNVEETSVRRIHKRGVRAISAALTLKRVEEIIDKIKWWAF